MSTCIAFLSHDFSIKIYFLQETFCVPVQLCFNVLKVLKLRVLQTTLGRK